VNNVLYSVEREYPVTLATLWNACVEVQLHDHLVHTLAYTQDADGFVARNEDVPVHIIRVEFEERGATSWCKFTQFGEMPAEQIPQTKAGMESYFHSLDEYLSRAG
jgi:hypothetical protein